MDTESFAKPFSIADEERTSLRSRVCDCGTKLLLKITKTGNKVTGICLTKDPETRTVQFINGKRSSRTLRTGSFSLAYMYCAKCRRRVQVRTFDTLEEYL
jgi:hypothetical protein